MCFMCFKYITIWDSVTTQLRHNQLLILLHFDFLPSFTIPTQPWPKPTIMRFPQLPLPWLWQPLQQPLQLYWLSVRHLKQDSFLLSVSDVKSESKRLVWLVFATWCFRGGFMSNLWWLSLKSFFYGDKLSYAITCVELIRVYNFQWFL